MFKKLKNLFHRHKFKTLSTRDYVTRGIMCMNDGGGFAYTEKGKKIIKICKCGYSIYKKVDIIRKREGE